jgi:2-keto-4-pentenoate hydratase/2-oxohepta-3-ene-1,7-dioic acid hydratase in catechol pathway
MRLVTYRQAAEPRLGALLGEQVVDLVLADAARREADPEARREAPIPGEMLALLRGGETAMGIARRTVDRVRDGADGEALAAAGALLPLADVDLLPPLLRPPKIICVGRNYADHVAEVGRSIPEVPVLFARFTRTLVGANDPIVRPWVSDQLDWEGELAVVIGATARHVAAADAYRVIAGYSLFNDVTVRDYQLRGQQFTAGKNFDFSGPFGPSLVTSDEIPDPHALELEVTVNDERMQAASTGEMIFSIPQLIEHITEWTTLEPGDVIPTGTPSGTGHAQRPHRFLVPGDRVRVTIPELGSLENQVIQEARA